MTYHKRSINVYSSIQRATVHGWTCPLSSDGYSDYGNSNQITSDGYGPHGFANPGAWCVLNKTIGTQQYQFCLQTDGYMGLRLKYSKLGFNNGLGNLTETPGATDQQILLGGGTDTTPTYQQILGGTLNFGGTNVKISIVTSTNILNFTLTPSVPLITTSNPALPKPVINTVLK
jgi:hypothetical protein